MPPLQRALLALCFLSVSASVQASALEPDMPFGRGHKPLLVAGYLRLHLGLQEEKRIPELVSLVGRFTSLVWDGEHVTIWFDSLPWFKVQLQHQLSKIYSRAIPTIAKAGATVAAAKFSRQLGNLSNEFRNTGKARQLLINIANEIAFVSGRDAYARQKLATWYVLLMEANSLRDAKQRAGLETVIQGDAANYLASARGLEYADIKRLIDLPF